MKPTEATANTDPIDLAADPAHTGIVIVDHGSRRAESNTMLEDFVAMFAKLAMPWYLSPLATVISPLVLQLPSIGSFAVHLC